MEIFDAARLLASGGFAVTLIVQIVKMAVGAGFTERTTVIVAAVSGGALTALFVVSTGALAAVAIFDIVIAWVTLTAIGAGIHSLATASTRST